LLRLLKDKIFYGWVVITAGIMIGAITFGIRQSFGVFFKSIETEFGLTRGATAGIFSVYMLLCSVVTIVGGWALDRYGPRVVTFLMGGFTGLSLLLTSQTNSVWQLYLTYGLLLSLGTGAIFTVINSTVSRWFDKKRGFAVGIASSGGQLGIVFLAPFATYLISNFGWRTAFMVIGFIAWLVVLSLSLLLRRDPHDIGLLPDGAKSEAAQTRSQNKETNTQRTGLSLLQACRTRHFWFSGLVYLFLSLSVHLVLTHSVPHAIDIGISPMDAAVILSIVGGACIAGRLVTGRISDIIGRKVPALTCGLLQVGALVWLVWIRELWMFYLFAAVFGFSWGGLGTQITLLIGDVFGMHSIGTILGVLIVGWSVGAAIGSAAGGFIFDVSGSYVTAFAVGAVMMSIATIFVVLTRSGMITESN
jgi:MFS family permease